MNLLDWVQIAFSLVVMLIGLYIALRPRRGVLWHFGGSAFGTSPPALAGFFQQLDVSHGSPRDERTPGAFFFSVFFFCGFYGDSTSVVANQPSVEAAPSREPHGYSLSVPRLTAVCISIEPPVL